MPRLDISPEDRTVELLEKLLAIQLHQMGVPQARIAKLVGRQTLWVNSVLKGLPSARKPI